MTYNKQLSFWSGPWVQAKRALRASLAVEVDEAVDGLAGLCREAIQEVVDDLATTVHRGYQGQHEAWDLRFLSGVEYSLSVIEQRLGLRPSPGGGARSNDTVAPLPWPDSDQTYDLDRNLIPEGWVHP